MKYQFSLSSRFKNHFPHESRGGGGFEERNPPCHHLSVINLLNSFLNLQILKNWKSFSLYAKWFEPCQRSPVFSNGENCREGNDLKIQDEFFSNFEFSLSWKKNCRVLIKKKIYFNSKIRSHINPKRNWVFATNSDFLNPWKRMSI